MYKPTNHENRKGFRKNRRLLVFKKLDNEQIGKELIAIEFAKLLKIPTIEIVEVVKSKGILARFISNCNTMHNLTKLTKKQIIELRKIILFDIWLGNCDRHSANIIIHKNLLIPIDHTKIFVKKERAINYIKLDVGRKLSVNYIEKIEKLLSKQATINTSKSLISYFGFKKQDFEIFKEVSNNYIKKIITQNKFIQDKDKKEYIKFLIFRKENIECLQFI